MSESTLCLKSHIAAHLFWMADVISTFIIWTVSEILQDQLKYQKHV